jgi:hypothetical protein
MSVVAVTSSGRARSTSTGVAQFQRHGSVRNAEIEIADSRLSVAELVADVIDHRIEPLGEELAGIDLIEQMRTALQIEAQADHGLRHPAGKPVEIRARHQVGRGEDHAQQDDAEDDGDFQFRELQHGGWCFAIRRPLRRRSRLPC